MNSFEKIEFFLNDKIVSKSSISGGCIGDSYIIQTNNGSKYFLKTYSVESISLCEAHGLKEIASTKKIKVPEVIWNDEYALLIEFIQSGKRSNNFFSEFGSQLAEMHKIKFDYFGYYEDNFIGSNKQKNIPTSFNWAEFYWNNRIMYQLNLAKLNGYNISELFHLSARIEKNLPNIIPDDDHASLLHGDLWAGNFLCDSFGSPVIIDPAVYFGNREAELAMTILFGGFDNDFYSAYNETYPLNYDWKNRIDFYKLYHVLNHLNLFGMGYYSQAVQIMKKYA